MESGIIESRIAIAPQKVRAIEVGNLVEVVAELIYYIVVVVAVAAATAANFALVVVVVVVVVVVR